ncbi:hypothetical protein [Agrococcus sp. SCSIO52902]|uniref:DUF6993 domain-containing protein n=1 Tax=Agrococcus sp. SCSIO52902 TaxID=2933290 RepID=UPI001FF1C621|nr:hypothetical protein [Agrococcus sp. SCSIO52902]UOW00670.1 hypothetical protein MU522_12270 [Agrococcus sp. SCSIO52902]
MRQLAAVVLLASLVLAGCATSPGPAEPVPEASPEAGGPADAPAPSDEGDEALAVFRSALEGQSPSAPDALVAAVEAAGFERSAIERTREVDSLGAPVTFVQIAVRDGDGCLVGSVGEGEATAVRASALGSGRCLVGEIVTVD